MDIDVDRLIAVIGSRAAGPDEQEWLTEQMGPDASDAAEQLSRAVAGRLGRNMEFLDASLADSLVDALRSDSGFARHVGDLMEAFEASTPDDFNLTVVRPATIGVGGGRIAGGSIVAGARGDSINIGTVAYAPPPGPITIPDKPR